MSKIQQHQGMSLFLRHRRQTKPESICLGFPTAIRLGLLFKIIVKHKAEGKNDWTE